MCELGRSPNNSPMVLCGDGVVVAAAHNATAMDVDDVAAADDVVATTVVDA